MSAILFPHSWLSSSYMKNIIDIFGSLTIFCPWYMDEVISKDEFEKFEKVNFIYPRSAYKPGKEFKSLISEFRNWIAYNNDRSSKEIIKFGRPGAVSDENLWDIRRMIKRIDDIGFDHDENQIFKWNFHLHLVADIERQRFEADTLLKELKKRSPLLNGSVETVKDVESLFRDFPDFDPETAIHESGIGPLLEAWFGLFGSYLDEHEIFVTVNKKYLDYIVEQVENLSTNVKDSMIILKIPEIWLKDESKIKKLQDRLTELKKNPAAMLSEIDSLLRSFHETSSTNIQCKNNIISMIYLEPTLDFKTSKKDNFLTKLPGKVVALFQED